LFHASHQIFMQTYFGDSVGDDIQVLIIVWVSLIIGDLHQLRRITMNPKDGGARTEVGPHNTIRVAMEDLPKAERST
jgi:hypothetical protein